MNNKIHVALIYKNDYPFLSGRHFDNTTYYFFIHALQRNKLLDVTFYTTQKKFDCSKFLSAAKKFEIKKKNSARISASFWQEKKFPNF